MSDDDETRIGEIFVISVNQQPIAYSKPYGIINSLTKLIQRLISQATNRGFNYFIENTYNDNEIRIMGTYKNSITQYSQILYHISWNKIPKDV